MKNTRGVANKKLIIVVTLILMAITTVYGVVNITYATLNTDNIPVNVKIIIDENIETPEDDIIATYEGSLYSNGLWYPGYREKGRVAIKNNHTKARMVKLGVKVDIAGIDPGTALYDTFLDNMKLTVEKGRIPVFMKTIVDDKSLSDLLYIDGSTQYTGYDLEGFNKLNIKSGKKYTDIIYTLHMDEGATDELENIKSTIKFFVVVEER